MSRSNFQTILDFGFERVVGFVVELELEAVVGLASSVVLVAAVDHY